MPASHQELCSLSHSSPAGSFRYSCDICGKKYKYYSCFQEHRDLHAVDGNVEVFFFLLTVCMMLFFILFWKLTTSEFMSVVLQVVLPLHTALLVQNFSSTQWQQDHNYDKEEEV